MSDDLSKELAGVRAEIDGIDSELLKLLNRRARCAQKVGEIKVQHGEAGHIYRPEREAQVLRRLQGENAGPFDDEQITWFFRELMSACLALEKPLEVAYLGPEGSFTGSAAAKHFGHAAYLSPQVSIDDVFREVESGHADYAVVPVENSTEGAVGRTMDLLFGTPLRTCGEVIVRIHQNLMTRCAKLEEVTKVYSHAQSLAQCHEWLNHNLPGVPRIPMASNSLAAKTAADEGQGAAAIAGAVAGERYGLPLLARNIEDDPNNTTRFLVLGRHEAGVSGKDKTSLIMSAPNRTGALHDLLVPFAESGVSLTRLESRPARQALWQYVFYVDIDGHSDEPRVKAALDELARRAAFLKVLGSYPAAVF